MAARMSLSKFLPDTKASLRPHREMGEDGRFYFKGKLMGFKKRPKSQKKHPSGKNCHQRRKEAYVPTGNPPGFHKEGAIWKIAERGKKKGFTHGYKIRDLVVAIKKVEEELSEEAGKPVDLLEHFVKKGFKDNPILKELMKKLLPDLKHVEADIDVTEQFQLIIDATGTDEDDEVERKPKKKRRKGKKRA